MRPINPRMPVKEMANTAKLTKIEDRMARRASRYLYEASTINGLISLIESEVVTFLRNITRTLLGRYALPKRVEAPAPVIIRERKPAKIEPPIVEDKETIAKMKKAIVIGASSGIGSEVAKVLSENGYAVGLVARRTEFLMSMQKEIGKKTYVKSIDIADTAKAMYLLDELIDEMGGRIDLVVFSAGIGGARYDNPMLDWSKEKETVEVNVMGFAAIANVIIKYFQKQGFGDFVGISSVAALRGMGICPCYNASKSFMSNYLEGLRQNAAVSKGDINIIDIRPGYVDTDMIKGQKGTFWIVSKEEAARQIYETIKRKEKIAYISKRWRLIAWLLKITPNWLYDRFVK